MTTRSCPKCSLLMARCDFKFCPDCGARLDSPSSSDATDCCASLTDLLPPPNIVDAAEMVRVWMETNGCRKWQLGGVCDRRFADECKRLKAACDKWSEDEILNPLINCQQCGKFREHGHACDSLHNVKVEQSPLARATVETGGKE